MRGVLGFARKPIIVLTPAKKTVHGKEIADPDLSKAASRTVTGCLVQPLTGTENLDHRDAVLAQWQIEAPAGSAIEARELIKFGGLTFEIVGTPLVFDHGLSTDHVQILVRRWEG